MTITPVLGEIFGWELLVVLAVVVLVFGNRLPSLARSLGRAKSQFEKGLHEDEDEPAD